MSQVSNGCFESVGVRYGNHTFQLAHADPQDHVAKIWKATRSFYELEYLVALSELIQPGDFVVDVGANVGNHAVFFAGVCRARVIAFEPNRRAARLLRANLEANGLDGAVKIAVCALGAGYGRGQIDISRATHNLGAGRVSAGPRGNIRIRPLDLIKLPAAPKLLKIDAEGMDFAVLQGARRTLREAQPIVCIEAPKRSEFIRIANFLEGLGYVCTQSHNYTPTHIFQLVDTEQQRSLLMRISREHGLRYIDQASERAQSGQRGGYVDRKGDMTAAHRKNPTANRNSQEPSCDAVIVERLAAHGALLESMTKEVTAFRAAQAHVGARVEEIEKEITRAANLVSNDVAAIDDLKQRLTTMLGAQATALARVLDRLDQLSQERDIVLDARSSEELGCLDPVLSWDHVASPRGSARLDYGGAVVIESAQGPAGVVTREIKCKGGGLIEASIRADVPYHPHTRLVVHFLTERGERVGPDFPLMDGRTSVHVFAPDRTKRLQISIVALEPSIGYRFRLSLIRFARLDGDQYQREVWRKVGEPVVASMASIPSRRGMLRDTVNSLLLQCNLVRVFLNGYPDVPDFLNHSRIEVRRSQDWDDRGDAGKFFWLDKDDQPGFRLIVDDDLIFPPDFATTLCKRVADYGNRAIFAVHGVLLRHPIEHYYDDNARAVTFHFAGPLSEDRTVHIGATNALCMHSTCVSMKYADFMYRNSADIWLAKHAQQHGIPIITPSRPEGWVRENRHEDASATIYAHSRHRTGSLYDSSLVQDAVLRRLAPLTTQPTRRPKFGLALVGTDANSFDAALTSWQATRSLDIDWVVFLARLPEATGVEDRIAAAKIPHETHIVGGSTGIDESLKRICELSHDLRVQSLLICSDGLRFEEPGWEQCLVGQENGPDSPTTRLILARGERISCSVESTPSNGSHIQGLALLLDPQSTHRFRNEHAHGATAHLGFFLKAAGSVAPALAASFGRAATQDRAMRADSETPASLPTTAPIASRNRSPGRLTINRLFERVVVLNLDRRRDRWESMTQQLKRLGIQAERFAAVDGLEDEVRAEYQKYARSPLVTVSPDLPPVLYAQDLFVNYPSQMARIAHIEQTSRKKAIASPGAWGYLKSYERVLEQALADQVETLLVLDDDVVFHKQTQEILAEVVEELPAEWVILQLGTLQYNWAPPWVEWRSPCLYSTSGSAIGSHSVGMRFEILPLLLDHVKRMDMPYDIGALSAVVRAFSQRSFVVYPNIAIQSLVDSDILTSDFQKENGAREAGEVYRWRLADYCDGE